MVNHFRTLILNRPPLGEDAGRFSQYVPRDFRPVDLDGVEAGFRRSLFGENSTREREELLSTVFLRLVLDYRETRQIAEGVDDRVTFDPRDPIFAQFSDPASSEGVVTSGGSQFTLGGALLTMTTSEEGDPADAPPPIIPAIDKLWEQIKNGSELRPLFQSTGVFSETLSDLSVGLDSLKRDDHRIAVALCAYCLHLTEKL